jgi:hypothetical protein
MKQGSKQSRTAARDFSWHAVTACPAQARKGRCGFELWSYPPTMMPNMEALLENQCEL